MEAGPRYKIISAYRHLYRNALKAVMHSQPGSSVVRDLLRTSFRDKNKAQQLDPRAVSRTGYFLHKAATENGIEHKILKNLLLCKYWKDQQERVFRQTWTQIIDPNNPQGKAARKPNLVGDTVYVHYQKTIEMLNKSHHLCLPTKW